MLTLNVPLGYMYHRLGTLAPKHAFKCHADYAVIITDNVR